MLILYKGFLQLKYYEPFNKIAKNSFSIVIPFRNEAENLPRLIDSLMQLNYPNTLFEIIFVDDASEDYSDVIIADLFKGYLSEEATINYTIIKNERHSNSPKKDAITTAINSARFEWIVTTDADCNVPANWLKYFDSFIQNKNPKMVCGPVIYNATNNFVEKFQQLDGFSLQFATIGSFGLKKPMLCNGANLAYRKDVFYELAGFFGNNHMASGDDIFMMDKIETKFPGKVLFVKQFEMAVRTQPQKSWTEIVNQRVRWSSKTSKTKNLFSKTVAIIVVCTNVMFIFGFIYIVIRPQFLPFLLISISLKLCLDFFTLKAVAQFLKEKFSISHFLKSSLIYPILIAIITLRSLTGTYSWKGRKFLNKP